ncbi:kinesin-like protein KIN-13A isoform X1 [Magnolia sinica]|uniref:kinesin-like protein KIN-13A isoform X1 n=1 Tax=Magnolia sinica TaxID=86752 RepID=UPI0026598523|nr:kinesin-like protein KIN-13A isoform X1 [Magnolia sinica]
MIRFISHFVGANSQRRFMILLWATRGLMISCISPNAGSCEHTLNTLRYADRVKSLSKSGNAKKDPVLSPTASKESSSASLLPVSGRLEDPFDQNQEVKVADPSQRVVENFSYNSTADFDRHSSSFPANYPFNGREESGATSSSLGREMVDVKNGFGGSISNKPFSYAQNSYDIAEDEKVQKEEKALISAHRKEIEETMEIVREMLSDNRTSCSCSSAKQKSYPNLAL